MTEKSTAHDGKYWAKRLAPFKSADNRSAAFQLSSTLLLFVAAWVLMYRGLEVGWWVTLLIAPVAAMLVVRLFIIQHDCGHGSFTTSQKANHVIGFWLGVLTLTPYRYWKKTHAIHHATSGDLDRRTLGDIDTLTVAEYRALPLWRRLAYRAYRHPLVLLGIGPVYQFIFKHRFPWDAPFTWKKEWRGVLLTDAVLVLVVALMWRTIGLKAFLMVQLPISFLAGPLGIWLFYVQHQFEGTYWARRDEWDFYEAALKGSSFYDLPAVLHWFTGSIGYHHIHHMASRVPNYRLKECFDSVEELQHPTALKFFQSLRCLRLKLWDEDSRQLVGFP